MRLKAIVTVSLLAALILFIGKTRSDQQTNQCKPEIVQLKISGTRMPGMPLKFKVDAANSCAEELYFRYFYRANYGTPDYDTSPWVLMHEDDYVTDREITYTFSEEGKYIVVVWAFTDPNNIRPQTTCGGYVEISRSCLLSIDSMDVTGLLNPAGSCTIRVNRSNYGCGYKSYSYKYFCRANYGNPDYVSTPWVLMHDEDYVDTSELGYAFPEANDYIVVVWLIEDPENINPRAVPIIGQTVSIHDTFELNFVETLEDLEAEFTMSTEQPESGDVYLNAFLSPGNESLTIYGTGTTQGPDMPITMFEFNWIDSMVVNYDSQERPVQVEIEDRTRNVEYLTDISYYPDGSYDITTYIDGDEAYRGNSDEVNDKIENGIYVEDNPFLNSTNLSISSIDEEQRGLLIDNEEIAEDAKKNIIRWGIMVANTVIPDQINYKTSIQDVEAHPYIKMLLSNPDLVVQIHNVLALQKLLNRFKYPEITCESKTGSARERCISRIKKAHDLLSEFGRVTASGVAGLIIQLSEDFFKLPLGFPATYRGTGLVRAFDCGDCGGYDSFTVVLEPDGVAKVIWTFNISTTGSACNVVYGQPRTKTGTHDMKGHFNIPDHNIYGGYSQGMASGGGTKTGGICGVTIQFQCERQ